MWSTVVHSVLLYVQPLFRSNRFQVLYFQCILLILKDKFFLSAFQHVGLLFPHDMCSFIYCCNVRVRAVLAIWMAPGTALASCTAFRLYNNATKSSLLAAQFDLCQPARHNYLYRKLSLLKIVWRDWLNDLRGIRELRMRGSVTASGRYGGFAGKGLHYTASLYCL
jgi:hypothetical protein